MGLNDFILWPGILVEFLGIIVIVIGLLIGNTVIITTGGVLLCLAVAVHVTRICHGIHTNFQKPAAGTPDRSGSFSQPDALYSDNLVTLTEDSITFHHYDYVQCSYPFFISNRTVLYPDIERIVIWKPSVLTGKWRLCGSSDLSTWFPYDGHRPSRDRIFRAHIRTGGMNVGFTVEDPLTVTAILRKKGIPIIDEVSVWVTTGVD